jgi:hypothetical protein
MRVGSYLVSVFSLNTPVRNTDFENSSNFRWLLVAPDIVTNVVLVVAVKVVVIVVTTVVGRV